MNIRGKELINKYGKEKQPFIFILDFDLKDPIILPLDEVDESEILFDFLGFSNSEKEKSPLDKKILFKKFPVSQERYENAFDIVMKNLVHGNSYLLNLTQPSKIETNLSLQEIFHHSKAKYKLWLKDQFVVFSPEHFIRIKDQKIYSYPMKGTIDASIPNAKDMILNDPKELAEHNTIVDLIRNDLSMVSKKVRVERFRYIDKIETHDQTLLQVSSEIVGDLKEDYASQLGDLLYTLLPAGSICGAPKKKTVEVIREAEKYERGYYTGICGYFDGEQLESGVMIRFIQQEGEDFFFKSGGGITVRSDKDKEYQELIDKVYVPIYRDNQV